MRKKTVKRTLNYEERLSIAHKIKDGGHMKQIAAEWQISLAYAYQIFYEFLEWKAEWKHKQ